VTRVDPAGASFVPAMRRGFIVMEINRRLVRSTADFEQMLAAARPGETLAFYGYDPTQAQRTLVIATVDDSR
jgi:S1-C subfamily serine protease